MLTLQWVDVEVLRPRVPADDHAAIDRHSRLYEQRPPLLQVPVCPWRRMLTQNGLYDRDLQ